MTGVQHVVAAVRENNPFVFSLPDFTLLNEGLTLADMGQRLGKAKTTVSYWMEFHGLEPLNRATHARPRNIDRERLERIALSHEVRIDDIEQRLNELERRPGKS